MSEKKIVIFVPKHLWVLRITSTMQFYDEAVLITTRNDILVQK